MKPIHTLGFSSYKVQQLPWGPGYNQNVYLQTIWLSGGVRNHTAPGSSATGLGEGVICMQKKKTRILKMSRRLKT